MISEHEVARGKRLEVYVESDIDSAWVNVPHTEHLNTKIIRPRDVEYFISEALDQGWTPKVKGAPAVFNFDGKFLRRRLQ
ncbi:hypothetical protein [Paenibacillus illinoisensis]|uniref:hypothetical protein n=1 Tax=Paenibacillus illinoisensis TaxID=59845 RepID=UPI003D953063